MLDLIPGKVGGEAVYQVGLHTEPSTAEPLGLEVVQRVVEGGIQISVALEILENPCAPLVSGIENGAHGDVGTLQNLPDPSNVPSPPVEP